MNITLLHLSDIHFTQNRNVVYQRKEKIFDCIKNEIKGNDVLFIITSGDISFSGKNEEYKIAQNFYKYLYQSLKEYTSLSAFLIFIPGNHDCVFDERQDQIRKIILESLQQKGLTEITESMIEVCCSTQKNYNLFANEISGKLPYNGDLVFEHPLLKIVTFKIGEKIFKFNLYNTSWDSSLNEKIGNLKYPIDYLYNQIPTIDNYLSISLVHHPFNWQTPENSKEFREALAFSSELIVSGHEHQASESLFSDVEENYKTIHISSGALQESDNDRDSSFNLININSYTTELQIKSFKYDNINSDYRIFNTTDWKSISKEKKMKSRLFQIKKSYLTELENPGASFSHSQVDEIKLVDIYVPPYFNNISSFEKAKKTKFFNFIHSESALDISEKLDSGFLKVVLGNESSGKTALLKHFYLKYYSKHFYPVYLSIESIDAIDKEKIKIIVSKEFKKQYDELESRFEEIDYSRIILLIDDFQKFKLKNFKVKFIKNLLNIFDKIIITGNELMLYETYTDGENNKVELFDRFDLYMIQEFNPSLRSLLINKWYRLGKDYLTAEEKKIFYRQIDLATDNISGIIGKNFIPAYPIFILSILQALEGNQTDSTSNNLHAYYYELLITKALKRVLKDQDDIGFYMTFAKEYFYFLFDTKIRFKPISKDSFLRFLSSHSKKYDLDNINIDLLLSNLVKSNILRINDEKEISIAFKYLYYYFVAKFISDNINDDNVKQTVDKMTDRVYREEYSNILLFLTHLSKNNFIVNTLVAKSRKIFANVEPIKLETDIDFINLLQKELPQQVLKDLDIEDSRKQNLVEADNYEAEERELTPETIDEEYDLQ